MLERTISGRHRLFIGIVALVLAVVCIVALPTVHTGGLLGGSVLGLLFVAFLVIGTLSIGTSDQMGV